VTENGSDQPSSPGRRFDRKLVKRIVFIALGMFLTGFAVMSLAMWITAPRRTVVTVPDVRWMTQSQAKRTLEAADLELQIGDSVPNPTVPVGGVLAQTPLPSQEVGPGSRVTLIVSSGPQRRAVPDVSMLSKDEAARVLAAAGFRVTVSEEKNPRAAGRVLGTEPATGTVLPSDATIRLRVSAGPPMVAVPPLVGTSEAQMAAALEAAGLRVGKVNHVFDLDGPPGIVLSQSPVAGDSTQMGSAIDAVVSSDQLLGTPVAPTSPREER
jgi:serine/threonine-protein kinase